MNKKKVIIFFVIVIVIAAVAIGICFVAKNDTEKAKDKVGEVCNKIAKSKENKESFVVIIMSKYNTNGDSRDAIVNFKKMYKDSVVIHDVDFDIINNECFANIFEDTGAYEFLKQDTSSPAIFGYKSGVWQGMTQNQTSEYGIEEFLVELDVIAKKEIKEEITYDDYLKNKQQDGYLLLVMSEETTKEEVSGNMNKVFPSMNKNTVNKRSSVGEKIMEDIEKDFEPENVFPQAFYFKNGKVLVSQSVFGENSFNELKETIDNLG